MPVFFFSFLHTEAVYGFYSNCPLIRPISIKKIYIINIITVMYSTKIPLANCHLTFKNKKCHAFFIPSQTNFPQQRTQKSIFMDNTD